MWYVLCEDGIYGEYEDLNEAEEVCGRLQRGGDDAWIASDDDDYDEPDDIDDDFGFDPYCGCYTYDC